MTPKEFFDKVVEMRRCQKEYFKNKRQIDLRISKQIKCNNYKVTLYKDKGVTPFIMRCKCGGDMMHTKSSKQAPPSYVKVHNWVRPSLEQTMSLSESMRNHILNGGLILEDELK